MRSRGITNIESAIASFQQGIDRNGNFRLIYQHHYPRIRGFFAKRGFSPQDCLDLTQETFLSIYSGLEGYRGDAPFLAWVFQIAANVYRKRLREAATAKRMGQNVPLVASTEEPEKDGNGLRLADPSNRYGPEEHTLDRERRNRLRQAIGELPGQRRRCMMLWVYRELTYDQIATALQLSIGTVKAHLAQAKVQLKEHLEE